MSSIIDALRNIVGTPNFYKQLTSSSSSYSWDYAAMFEYFFSCLVLCIVIGWVFRFLKELFL